jgi:hypothetical protein
MLAIYERQTINKVEFESFFGTMGKLPWAGNEHDFDYIVYYSLNQHPQIN